MLRLQKFSELARHTGEYKPPRLSKVMENTLELSTKARGDPDWPDQDGELNVLLTDFLLSSAFGLIVEPAGFSTMYSVSHRPRINSSILRGFLKK